MQLFKQSSFSAWYYPWATVEESSLKRALFYFDKISISSEMSFHRDLSYGTDAALQYLNDKSEKKLPDGRVIKTPIDQKKLDRINELLAFRASVVPLKDAGVINLKPDLMPISSIEDIERLDKLREDFSNTINCIDPSSYGIEREELVDNVSSCMTPEMIGVNLNYWPELTYNSFRSQLSDVALYSLLRGEFPITDDIRMHRIFADIMASKQTDITKNQVSRSMRHSAADALAVTVMQEFLPDFKFQTYEDVLEAREMLADELLAFRSYMIDLSTRISVEPTTAAFAKEAQRLSSITVGHAVNDLKRKVRSSRKKFFLSLGKNILWAAPFSLATIAYPSSPPLLLWAVGAGLLTGFEISKYHVDDSKINDVSFILSAQKLK